MLENPPRGNEEGLSFSRQSPGGVLSLPLSLSLPLVNLIQRRGANGTRTTVQSTISRITSPLLCDKTKLLHLFCLFPRSKSTADYMLHACALTLPRENSTFPTSGIPVCLAKGFAQALLDVRLQAATACVPRGKQCCGKQGRLPLC